MSENEEKITVKVVKEKESTDKKVEQFEKEAELEAKLEKAEFGEKIFDEVKSKVESDYTEKGLRMPNITDSDSLKDAMKNLEKIEQLEQNQKQKPKVETSGSLPLSANLQEGERLVRDPQFGSYTVVKEQGEKFGSVEQMIDTLQDRASNGDKNSQAILEAMLLKFARGLREKPSQITYEDNEWLNRIKTQKRRRRLQSGNYRGEQ